MVTPGHWWRKKIFIGPLNRLMTSNRRTSSISVWTKSQLTDPVLESFYSTPFCLKYIHSNFWLPTLLFIALVRTSYWLFCSIPFHAIYSHISNTSLITPTEFPIFIYYIYLPCSCYMFHCITLHRQAERTCPLLTTTCCYIAVIYGYYGSCVMKYTRYNFAVLHLQ